MKKITCAIAIICVSISSPISALAAQYTYPLTTDSKSIVTYADSIVWKYKIVNGKMYKRQFNQSKNKWIGDWILVK